MAAFTLFHVLISLVGIATGLVVLFGMIRAQRLDSWTTVFLATTVATSVTGFLFPFNGVTPGIIVGILSLLVLAPAIYGRYSKGLAGGWRKAYVIGSVIGLYFNVFVFIVQSFQKLPALHSLAPTGTEVPFQLVQGINLVSFVTLGVMATKGFHPERLGQSQGQAGGSVKSAVAGK
jgi:hypothetical protein